MMINCAILDRNGRELTTVELPSIPQIGVKFEITGEIFTMRQQPIITIGVNEVGCLITVYKDM